MSLFVIGNALVDCQNHLDDLELLKKYECTPNITQVVLHEADAKQGIFPILMDKKEKKLSIGGSEMNTVKAANFVLAAQGLKGQVTFFGGAGADENAKMI